MKKSKAILDQFEGVGLFDVGSEGWASSNKSLGSKKVFSCYMNHPPLRVGEFLIYGGSCGHPKITDADVYIGFDYSMKATSASFPWNRTKEEIYFPIPDGSAPKNTKDFKDLVDWSIEQLKAGKKVHAGCIGGHGRTGTYLAAIVAQMTGELDAVTYVRKHYCVKAVESSQQMNFLHKHYGIKAVSISKNYLSVDAPKGWVGSSYTPESKTNAKTSFGKTVITPVESAKNIWVSPKNLEKNYPK